MRAGVFQSLESRHKRIGAGLGLGLVLVSGCFSPEPPTCANSGESVCIADTRVHEVCPAQCFTLEDCPVGSRCIGDSVKQCEVPREPPSDRDRLTNGFGVDELSAKYLSNENDDSRVLDWSAPEDTRLVICALFQCPPVVAVPERSEVATILNFDRCVVAQASWTEREGVFNPRDLDLAWEPPKVQTTEDCAESTSARQPVAALLAGCWAYDNWGLIAASDLLSFRPDEVYDFRDNLARGSGGSCEPADEGRSCSLDTGGFGTCVMGDAGTSCRARCLSHADCREYCENELSSCSNGSASPSEVLGVCDACEVPP